MSRQVFVVKQTPQQRSITMAVLPEPYPYTVLIPQQLDGMCLLATLWIGTLTAVLFD